MLCAAAELEHALMCEYLFAAFTLKRSTDEGLTEDQLGAVERWRQTLLLVAKQEMLHLALNCNLVNALGASPHLSRPNLPQPARHYPSGVQLTLLPFGEQALTALPLSRAPRRHGLRRRRRSRRGRARTPGNERAGDRASPPGVRDRWRISTARSKRAFATSPKRWVRTSCSSYLRRARSEAICSVGHSSDPITCVDDVVQAIETIVEQGEGARGDWRNAHFGRFVGVLDEFLAMQRRESRESSSPDPCCQHSCGRPRNGEPADLISDPKTAAVADLGNVAYEVLLQLLYRLLSRVDENDEQMKILSQVAIGLMFDVIEPLGDILTTLPVGPEHPGRTAGPTSSSSTSPTTCSRTERRPGGSWRSTSATPLISRRLRAKASRALTLWPEPSGDTQVCFEQTAAR